MIELNCPIIDCHCHVYPDKIVDKAVQSIEKFYDIDAQNGGRYDTLVTRGSMEGIKHYVVFSVATVPHQASAINRFIANTVESSGGIMTGLGTVHPDSENLEQEIEEIVSLGLKGIKLHPDFQKFQVDNPKYDKLYELCSGKIPIMMHTGDNRYDFSNPERVESVLKKFPNLTLIGAHFGGWSCWKQAAKRLYKYDNFFVDCSSTFDWLTSEETTELVNLYTADKVLFGTDFPLWSHKKELERFFEMELTQNQKEKILYKNSLSLFGIDENVLFLEK